MKYNGGETEDKYYEWYRTDFPIPVKTESLNGYMSYEYRRIKFTTLDPNLFNPPKRYKKITTEQLIELEKQWERSEKKGRSNKGLRKILKAHRLRKEADKKQEGSRPPVLRYPELPDFRYSSSAFFSPFFFSLV